MNVLYNACDVGMNTCIGEGFGLCSVEHALVGKPQIVSNVGGLRDIFKGTMSVVEPTTSYHIPNHMDAHGGVVHVCAVNDIVSKLTDVFNNYQKYSHHFESVSETLKERYSPESVEKQLEEILELNNYSK